MCSPIHISTQRPGCWLQDVLDNLESNLKPFLNKAPKELEQNVSPQSGPHKSMVV